MNTENSAIAADVTLRSGGSQITAHLYENGTAGAIMPRTAADPAGDSRYIYKRYPSMIHLLNAWREEH